MKPSTIFTSLTTFSSFVSASCLSGDVAVYWGQATGTASLEETCADDNIDIVILSFLTTYSSPLSINLWPANCYPDTSDGSWSYTCDGSDGSTDIVSGINYCQNQGKKVMLSIGGATSSSVLSGDADGMKFADELWYYFGPVSDPSIVRPFGDTVLDGFDFDIEGGSGVGLTAVANELRANFATDPSKQYYLSAAPQCPENDAHVGTLLNEADIDYAFIQFYNNYCDLDRTFNWDWWADWANTTSKNPEIKLFLGLAGSGLAAPSGGYVVPSVVEQVMQTDILPSSANFGGIMLWNAYYGSANVINGVNYIDTMASLLDNQVCGSDEVAEPSSEPSSTTTALSSSNDIASTTSLPYSLPSTSASSSYSESSSPSTSSSAALDSSSSSSAETSSISTSSFATIDSSSSSSYSKSSSVNTASSTTLNSSASSSDSGNSLVSTPFTDSATIQLATTDSIATAFVNSSTPISTASPLVTSSISDATSSGSFTSGFVNSSTPLSSTDPYTTSPSNSTTITTSYSSFIPTETSSFFNTTAPFTRNHTTKTTHFSHFSNSTTPLVTSTGSVSANETIIITETLTTVISDVTEVITTTIAECPKCSETTDSQPLFATTIVASTFVFPESSSLAIYSQSNGTFSVITSFEGLAATSVGSSFAAGAAIFAAMAFLF
ncbi:DEKNAAC104467 [Brettanomyces naardenensis]|uniref:chitinase n=1 Tax=Brettanomyces naardenensis TaxID=13370 RepID=A0A448YRF9_BRENA|nr:DEKNAAC104467 [Brettanomyces naardenensis]